MYNVFTILYVQCRGCVESITNLSAGRVGGGQRLNPSSPFSPLVINVHREGRRIKKVTKVPYFLTV